MKIINYIFCGFLWNSILISCQIFSQERFREFSISMCGDKCGQIYCPENTVMKIQLVELSFDANLTKKDCFNNDVQSVNQLEYETDHCRRVLKLDWSQHIDLMCSNKSKCSVCPTDSMKIRHKGCLQISDIIVKHLCISNIFIEEKVPANSYIDLNCEYFIDHRIIIHRASLIDITKTSNNSGVGNNKACSQIDVSSSISNQCSFLTKCQAGPNPLILDGCKQNELFLQYACVPNSVIKTTMYQPAQDKDNLLSLSDSEVQEKSYVTTATHVTKESIPNKDTYRMIWIISGMSIVVLLFIIFGIIAWQCDIGIWKNRQNSLFNKIKDVQFCPPPTPIEKIQIDLSSENLLFLNHSKEYNSLIFDDLHKFQGNFESLSNTLSNNQTSLHSNLFANSSNNSNSANNNVLISSFKSDSSKENSSTIFNYLTSEKCHQMQTYI